MSDVSVLLNLTAGLSLEDSDPFMSLVADKGLAVDNGSLLFYDQLSVRRFPTERSQYPDFLENLLSNLRNLLESRSLSTSDRGEDVRLIVTIDLANGLFEPEGKDNLCFPAQKVRLFKQQMETVFGKDNPLLPRIKYFFIFLESNLPSVAKLVSFYRSASYDGISGDFPEWIREDMLKINNRRDAVIKEVTEEDDALLETVPQYSEFVKELKESIKTVRTYLDKAQAGPEFSERVEKELDAIKVWNDFINTDFDRILFSSLNKAIGLSSDEFTKNDSFFFVKLSGSPAAVKRRDETYILSLVLLLVTLSQNDYDSLFNTGSSDVFVMGTMPAESHLDGDQLFRLHDGIQFCLNKLKETGDLRIKKDGRVTFRVYSARSLTPRENDTHTPLNSEIDADLRKLHDRFVSKRKVPFFFGTRPGDWTWWNDVEDSLNNLYEYEKENSRPLYDSPRRITDKEMSSTEKECSYAELETIIAQQKEAVTESVSVSDINDYLEKRNELLEKFEKAVAQMKEHMLKLGYLFNISWITVFLSLAITLCYSFHFFVKKPGQDPIWILACLAVSVILFFIGMVIAHSKIRQKIESSVMLIDSFYNEMDKERSNYLKQVEERARKQNEADIRRRNLAEMQDKIDAFSRHNLQVDKWETYYTALLNKMRDTLYLIGVPESKKKEKFKLEDNVFTVDGFPSIPSELSRLFRSGKTSFSCFNGKEFTDVISFVKSFEFTKCSEK